MLSERSAGCLQTQPLTQCRRRPLPLRPLPIPDQTWGLEREGGDEKDGRRCVEGGRGGNSTSCVKPHPEQASLHLTVNKYSLLYAVSVNCHRLGSNHLQVQTGKCTEAGRWQIWAFICFLLQWSPGTHCFLFFALTSGPARSRAWVLPVTFH